jgi:hypothetical protein
MTLILKIERALAFAKELGLNDNQTKELMALVLELPYFKLNLPSQPITQPLPWIAPNTPMWPNGFSTDGPVYPGDTIITYSVCPPRPDIQSINTCACSSAKEHSDSCKAADSLFK